MRTRGGRWGGFDVAGQLTALRRYARALTRDEAAAEDLVHDTLLRAFEGRQTFRAGDNLRQWLLSILHNTFVGSWRSRKAELIRLERAAEVAERHYPSPAPEAAVRLGQIYRAFSALPDEQRAALHLVAVEGLSYQDAAAALDLPIGTLMSRIGRARSSLREFEQAKPLAQADIVPKETARDRLRIVGGSRGSG
jgi:RNA polymerase sigma-70 factor (ECF subfamily)